MRAGELTISAAEVEALKTALRCQADDLAGAAQVRTEMVGHHDGAGAAFAESASRYRALLERIERAEGVGPLRLIEAEG